MSLNPSLSHSSCLAAVSNSVESSAHLQVLHQLSTSLSVSVATLISRMAASAEASSQFRVVRNKHEDLSNDGQAQIIRHAISSADATLKDQEVQHVIEQLRVTSESSRQDSLSGASSSLRWKIILNSGTITHQMFVISLGHSMTFKATSRLSSTSVRASIGTTSSSVSQSSAHGAHMVGSSHQESQKRCQIMTLKSTILFTYSIGSVMRSITCTTSESLMASCSTVMWSHLMADSSSTAVLSGQRSRTLLKSQRKSERASCASTGHSQSST